MTSASVRDPLSEIKLVALCRFVRADLRRYPDQAGLVAGGRAVLP